MEIENLTEFIEAPLDDIKQAISSGKIYRGELKKVLRLSIRSKRLDVVRHLIDERLNEGDFSLTDADIKLLPCDIGFSAHMDILKYLLEKKILHTDNLEDHNVLGKILYESTDDSTLKMVKFLVEEKSYKVTVHNNDALTQAVLHNNPLTTQYLIDHGADVTTNNFLPYSFAATTGKIETLQLLERNGGEPPPNGNSALFEALEYHAPEDEIILYLINKGWNLNDENCRKYGPDSLVEKEKLTHVKRLIHCMQLGNQLPRLEQNNNTRKNKL